ncbi:MAG: hypothetical protein EU530_11350 [Promethearchaeota archaeon]|nr:MAG: hypothetical protein EU530_11350 [Candidatus Lokiarchaeota archaeon]
MIMYGIYIITDSGNLLFSESFQPYKGNQDDSMVSGLLQALNMFANEITDSEVRSFEVEAFTYHFLSFDLFSVVLVTSSINAVSGYLHQLGLRFMKKYGENYVTQKKIEDVSIFESFREDVKEILGSLVDQSHSLYPTKKLTTVEIFNFPEDLQKIALVMLELEQGNLKKIAEESNMDEKYALKLIHQLIEDRYLGKKTEKGQTIYFYSM